MAAPSGYMNVIADPVPPPIPGTILPYPDGRSDALTPKLSGREGMAYSYTKEGSLIAQGDQNAVSRWAVQLLQTQRAVGVFDLWIKATLARAAYSGIPGLIEAARLAVGADGYDSAGSPDPLVPNVYCYWWHRVGALVGVEGTSNYQQWISYVYNSDQVPAVAPDGTNYGRAFSAFQSVALACVPAAARLVVAHVPGQGVYQLIGHSLGGAVAHMLGLYLPPGLGFRPTLVTTFGAPRPGNRDYRTASAVLPTVRVVHEPDPVTQLPPRYFLRAPLVGPPVPAVYTHPVARRVGLAADGGYSFAGAGEGDEAGGAAAFSGLRTVAQAADRHVLKVYCQRLQDLMEALYPDESALPIPNTLRALNESLSRAGA